MQKPQNYEQIRAKHAIEAKDSISVGKEGGRTVAKKFPAMIIANGFLGALAFAEDSGEGLATVAFSVIDHLERSKILPEQCNYGMKSILDDVKAALNKPKANEHEKKLRNEAVDRAIQRGMPKLSEFIVWLAGGSASKLRMLTCEALSYLNYLRRFASPEKETGKGGTPDAEDRP